MISVSFRNWGNEFGANAKRKRGQIEGESEGSQREIKRGENNYIGKNRQKKYINRRDEARMEK